MRIDDQDTGNGAPAPPSIYNTTPGWQPNIGEVHKATFDAIKTLYTGLVNELEFTDVLVVPEKKSMVITNLWVHNHGSTPCTVYFRHQYQGAPTFSVFFSVYLDPTADPPSRSFHKKVGKVLEAGSILQAVVNGSQMGMTYMSLDGLEIAQS